MVIRVAQPPSKDSRSCMAYDDSVRMTQEGQTHYCYSSNCSGVWVRFVCLQHVMFVYVIV